jgi:tetraacyldisaccharide 4'-kinase
LRESLPRLNRIDALVVTGMQETLAKVVLAKQFGLNEHILIAQSQLAAGRFYALHDPTEQVDADYFAGKNVAALAGIGQPQKFFRTLHRLGVVINDKHGFADHHDYALQDVPQGMDALIVTEKDAVKLSKFPLENVWVLPVSATIEPDLAQFIMDKLSLD